MQQTMTATMAATGELTGRDASRARRAALAQGKTALPPPRERIRTGERAAAILPAHGLPHAPETVTTAPSTPRVEYSTVSTAGPGLTRSEALTGRALSIARRQSLSRGKEGLKQWQSMVGAVAVPVENRPVAEPASALCTDGSCRDIARALRAERARNGRGNAPPARPSGRPRSREPIKYPPKVADTTTYGQQRVTGIRIGRGVNVTGDEPGAALPVTGTQYIGTETGYTPRTGGVKVGAARTAGGLVVTGTQVRSQVKITGDESNPAIRITGEADQELADDLIQRPEQGAYVAAQFQRMHDPHGHSVFGTNLGRSIKTIGSRERGRERAIELTEGGNAISGTAVGRSIRVTGNEPGSCRHITGDQYLMPAERQSLCEVPPASGMSRSGMDGARGDERPDPVTGAKVTVSETWRRQRVTGVEVEHKPRVTGDEPGACAPVTGTPYVGPGQYEAYCELSDIEAAARRIDAAYATGHRVTGDKPEHTEKVTGTGRGAERALTGTPYYQLDVEDDEQGNVIERIDARFSVRSPQREAQLRASVAAAKVKTDTPRITGSFSLGEGKITGNQEFHFRTRGYGAGSGAGEEKRPRITGEGKSEGFPITGDAWRTNPRVTGTEGYIAAERNPSERSGKPHAFASAGIFKGKARHEPSKVLVTGMVGQSPKASARVTLSGGAQG
ncbi:MAG: CsoS2 family carboxysome shell protein [Pseudomonadota bacterium]